VSLHATGRSSRQASAGAGYTLVAMVVIFTVMTVGLAATLPYWSKIMQRDKEEELIFRGLQYAEAIRLFQLRFGRYPVRLEELMTVRPRCLRQLWKDPMTASGDWGLVLAQAGRRGRAEARRRGDRTGGQVSAVSPQDLTAASGLSQRDGRSGELRTVGPILGVHSTSTESGAKAFQGSKQYSSWKFRADIIPVAQVVPGSLHVPRVTSDWIGRPFPDGLEPRQGAAPSATGPADGRKKPNLPGSKRSRGNRKSGG